MKTIFIGSSRHRVIGGRTVLVMSDYNYLGTDLPSGDSEILNNMNDWAKLFGVIIVDPSGFDLNDPYLYIKLFTRGEFERGLVGSKVIKKSEDGD